jgi:molecular chaperone DnaK (HSP70)
MIVGIDLGVTDRRVGLFRNAAVDPVPDAFGLPPTPSAMVFCWGMPGLLGDRAG